MGSSNHGHGGGAVWRRRIMVRSYPINHIGIFWALFLSAAKTPQIGHVVGYCDVFAAPQKHSKMSTKGVNQFLNTVYTGYA